MKFKNKGRKIYKTKEKNFYGKTPVGKFFSGALTVLLVGGLCFLGYSVAEPLLNYSKKQGDSDVSSVTENIPEEGSTGQTASTMPVLENKNAELYTSYTLKTSDLAGVSSLRAALENVPEAVGIEYITVPLKVSGGEIYYASDVYEAKMSGAVQSALTLSEITYEIRSAGYRPTASISLLDDNILPQTYPEAGYRTTDDGSRWIDNSVENGGKPWVSPFTDSTKEYLGNIAYEIASADFDKAVCTDVIFPPFRESDLALLGDEVNSGERYLGLTSLVNMMYNTMIEGNTATMLEVSAVDLLLGNYEVIQPMLLDVNTLILNIDFTEMGNAVESVGTVYEFTGTDAENASKIIGLIQHRLGDYNIAVRFSGVNKETSSLLEAMEVLSEYGYTSYIIG